MENRIQQLFLATGLAATLAGGNHASAQTPSAPVQIIEPDVQPRSVEEPKIDTELFEAGLYGGVIGIEDFGSSALFGAHLIFHATEDFFLKLSYAIAEADDTSVEALSGQNPLPGGDRDYRYYDLSVGYNLFPGQVFISDRWTFNSAYYLTLGFGGTEFADDSFYTVTLGTGYKAVLTDWLTVHTDFKDHIFETDVFGPKKRTHNLEFSLGASVIF